MERTLGLEIVKMLVYCYIYWRSIAYHGQMPKLANNLNLFVDHFDCLISLYNRQSSAKSWTFELTADGKSLICKRKSKGLELYLVLHQNPHQQIKMIYHPLWPFKKAEIQCQMFLSIIFNSSRLSLNIFMLKRNVLVVVIWKSPETVNVIICEPYSNQSSDSMTFMKLHPELFCIMICQSCLPMRWLTQLLLILASDVELNQAPHWCA